MARLIQLRYPATCRDCGADLPVGARARYYGRGRVYGADCHPDRRDPDEVATARELYDRMPRRFKATGEAPHP